MAFDIRETTFELPENWKLVRLGDIAKVNEKSLTKKSQPDFIRYIDISSVSTGSFDTPKFLNINDAPSRAKRILRDNDFIISTVRPNLKQFSFIEEAKNNLIASTGFCVISSESSELAWYLYSLVTSDLFTEYLVKIADGGAYPAFNPKEIEDAIIPLPNKTVLKLISNTAKSFHQKIQLNIQINQTLEQIAQAIFKSWFVDFDPVRAKASAFAGGLTPAQAERAAMGVISGKNATELDRLQTENPDQYHQLQQLAAAFPSEFAEIEGFGDVPKGWGKVSISDKRVCEIIKPKINVFEGEKDYIATANVSGNSIVGTLEKITYENRPSRANMQPTIDSIWFAKMVGEHKAIMIDKNDHFLLKETILSTGFLGIKPKEKKKSFLYCFINSDYFTLAKNQLATGAVQIALTNGSFSKIEIILPSDNILELFENKICELFSKISQNQRENKILSQIRDELLPKLLSGEI